MKTVYLIKWQLPLHSYVTQFINVHGIDVHGDVWVDKNLFLTSDNEFLESLYCVSSRKATTRETKVYYRTKLSNKIKKFC